MKIQMKKILAVTLVSSLVAGCATPGPNGMAQVSNQGSNRQAAQEQDPCSVGNSALAGAAAGALLGALLDGKKGALRGAAAGGLVATLGCVAINSQSRQVRTAAQVDGDYIRARGRLPADPRVVSYQPRLTSSTVQRGRPMQVLSSFELVNGATNPVREVREDLVVYDPQGKEFASKAKPLVNHTGGRFENTFELTLPEGVSQGVYAMKTNLYVNGKLMESRKLNTQLVWNGMSGQLVASR